MLSDHRADFCPTVEVDKVFTESGSNGRNCQYCDKQYATKGKCLALHENKCMFNRVVASNTSYELFKSILPANGICPGCHEVYKVLFVIFLHVIVLTRI